MKITIEEVTKKDVEIQIPYFAKYKVKTYTEFAKFDGEKIFKFTIYSDDSISFVPSLCLEIEDIVKEWEETTKKEWDDAKIQLIDKLKEI